MVLGKVSDFLIKHQRLLTYLSIFATLMLLMRLVYDDVLIDHDNPIVLAIFIGILVLWTLASYLNRRQHMLSHFILQSSKLINVYAVDLDYRFIAVNKNDIRLMEEIFYFTPKIGDFPMNYLNSEDAARLKANVDRAKKGETFIFMDTIKTGDKTLYWQNMYSPIYNNRQNSEYKILPDEREYGDDFVKKSIKINPRNQKFINDISKALSTEKD